MPAGRPAKAARNEKIRQLYLGGMSMPALARRYRVTVQRIYQIVYANVRRTAP